MKNGIYIVLVLMSLCSIKNQKTEGRQEGFLEVTFLQQGISTPIGISCSMIDFEMYNESKHYKKILGLDTLNNFKTQFLKLKKKKRQLDINNIRIKILYKTRYKKDTICMGEYFNIFVNGVQMKDSKEFHSFVKEMIDYEYTIRHPLTGKMIPKEELKNK